MQDYRRLLCASTSYTMGRKRSVSLWSVWCESVTLKFLLFLVIELKFRTIKSCRTSDNGAQDFLLAKSVKSITVQPRKCTEECNEHLNQYLVSIPDFVLAANDPTLAISVLCAKYFSTYLYWKYLPHFSKTCKTKESAHFSGRFCNT